jgi:hypothetical protein
VDGDNDYLYPTELLNSLKPGVPIIIMHNLAAGLANGTRMLCHRLGADVIDALVLRGTAAGQRVLIPRMSLQPSEDLRLPFHMKRHQLPVRPAFALSINKAQGQTLQHVGVYHETPVRPRPAVRCAQPHRQPRQHLGGSARQRAHGARR